MRKHLLVLMPWFITCFGAGLNTLVLSCNHGVMPVLVPMSWDSFGVAPGSVMDEFHATWSAGVHLAFLCDWIVVRSGVCSIGDLFLWGGEWLAPYGIGAWLALCWCERKRTRVIPPATNMVSRGYTFIPTPALHE